MKPAASFWTAPWTRKTGALFVNGICAIHGPGLRGEDITIQKATGEFKLKGDPFEVLGRYLAQYHLEKMS